MRYQLGGIIFFVRLTSQALSLGSVICFWLRCLKATALFFNPNGKVGAAERVSFCSRGCGA